MKQLTTKGCQRSLAGWFSTNFWIPTWHCDSWSLTIYISAWIICLFSMFELYVPAPFNTGWQNCHSGPTQVPFGTMSPSKSLDTEKSADWRAKCSLAISAGNRKSNVVIHLVHDMMWNDTANVYSIKNGKYYCNILCLSDPHPEALFWHWFSHTNIYMYIYAHIWHNYSDILVVIYFDILSDIHSGIYSDILSGNYSDILAILTSFWHSIWHFLNVFILAFFLGTYADILSDIFSI